MIQSWNTIDLSENKAEIHQKWVNNCSLKNRRPVWSPINPNLINRGGLETANYPIVFEPPKLATQECKVWFKPEFCPETMTPNTFDAQLISICAGKRPVGGHIDPRNPKQIIYKDAIEDGIDLVYGIWDKRNPSFEKVIIFRKCPSGEYLDIDFEVKFPGGKLKGLRIFSKGGDKNISFENPVAWYYTGHKCIKHKIDITLKEVGNYRAVFTKRVPTKLIKAALSVGSKLFCDATSTFFPAVSSGGTSTDGYSERHSVGSSFSSIINGVGTSASDIDTLFYCIYLTYNTSTDLYDHNLRGYLTFSTSSISGNFVTSATLGIYGSTGGLGPSAPSSNTKFCLCGANLIAANKNAVSISDYSSYIPTLYSDSFFEYDTWNQTGAYNTFTLNNAGLAAIDTGTSGKSQFSTLLYYDYLGQAPTWGNYSSNYLGGQSADSTGTATDPKLTVTYLPTNPKPFIIF